MVTGRSMDGSRHSNRIVSFIRATGPCRGHRGIVLCGSDCQRCAARSGGPVRRGRAPTDICVVVRRRGSGEGACRPAAAATSLARSRRAGHGSLSRRSDGRVRVATPRDESLRAERSRWRARGVESHRAASRRSGCSRRSHPYTATSRRTAACGSVAGTPDPATLRSERATFEGTAFRHRHANRVRASFGRRRVARARRRTAIDSLRPMELCRARPGGGREKRSLVVDRRTHGWRRADQCGLAILAGTATRERRDRGARAAGAGCGASMDSRSGNPSPTTRFRRLAEAVAAPAYRTGLLRGHEYRRASVSTPGRIVGSTGSHQPVFDSRQRTIA